MKTIFSIFLGISFFAAKAQSKTFTYYLDEKLISVAKESAVIIGSGTQTSDCFMVSCFDASTKQLLAKIGFSDSTIAICQGSYTLFHSNLSIKTEGQHNLNEQNGMWVEYDSLNRVTDSTRYLKGKKMNTVSRTYWDHGQLWSREETDSLTDRFTRVRFDSIGKVTRVWEFKGQLGIKKDYTGAIVTTDSLFTRVEVSAEFPGGLGGWRRYLEKNLDAQVGYRNNIKPGVYKVMIKFIVDIDGQLIDIKPETSFGYGLENEAIRIIKKSGKWIPAKEFGYLIKAYRRQPVTFVFE